MPEKKFDIPNQTGTAKTKDFSLPSPGPLPKPNIILGGPLLPKPPKFFINTQIEDEDREIGRSRFSNRPIYCDITFNKGDYIDQNGQEQTYGPLNVEDVLVTVMNTKNIIETTLQGRNGTVKEYISDGDYTITIQGKLYGNGMNNYPQDDVQNLHNICLAPQAINVTSAFLKMFNVEDIVIKSYTFDQLEGIRNYQPFILNCVSDYPLILLKNA